jgi:arginine utilization protein RocB
MPLGPLVSCLNFKKVHKIMNKQEAFKTIDGVLAQLTCKREDHMKLSQALSTLMQPDPKVLAYDQLMAQKQVADQLAVDQAKEKPALEVAK